MSAMQLLVRTYSPTQSISGVLHVDDYVSILLIILLTHVLKEDIFLINDMSRMRILGMDEKVCVK